MNSYLKASDVIDFHDPEVGRLASQLAQRANSQPALAKCAFEWVRDNIQHCMDFDRPEVTCAASDVLRVGTGFCYAKSHLLAALLRANGIPTGFCYQRLSLSGDGPPFTLHGLDAVFLPTHGWYRIDARGNSATVHADFCPPHEKLAFSTEAVGETDFSGIRSDPLPLVIEALQSAPSAQELVQNLPDLPPLTDRDLR